MGADPSVAALRTGACERSDPTRERRSEPVADEVRRLPDVLSDPDMETGRRRRRPSGRSPMEAPGRPAVCTVGREPVASPVRQSVVWVLVPADRRDTLYCIGIGAFPRLGNRTIGEKE
jgi:hypothetical protein